MTLTVYGLKNCDTCKKALKALEGRNVTFVDIRTEVDLSAKLPGWLTAVGPSVLVNKRSTTWRTLSDTEKAKAETDHATALLEDNPTLIKRPVIENGKTVTVGWSAATANTLGID